MDRRVMYKLNLRADSNQSRLAISNKQRANNRSKAFLKSRKITNCDDSTNHNQLPASFSLSETAILTDSTQQNKNPDASTNSIEMAASAIKSNKNLKSIKVKENDKKLSYLERYRKWKQDKENRLKEEKEKKKAQKPFISAVRPGSAGIGTSSSTSVGTARKNNNDFGNRFAFKPPLPQIQNVAEKNTHLNLNKNDKNPPKIIKKNANVQEITKKSQQQIQNHGKATAIVKPLLQKQRQQKQPSKETKQNKPTVLNNLNNNNHHYLDVPTTPLESNPNVTFVASTSYKQSIGPSAIVGNHRHEEFVSSDDEIISPIEKLSEENVICNTNKDKQESNNETKNDDDDEIRKLRNTISHYRNLLETETNNLKENCLKWESYQKSNLNLIQKEGNDIIDVAIGQTKLLIKEKFQQFQKLLNDCEMITIPKLLNIIKNENSDGNNEHKLILSQDIEGFWSIIELQISNINNRFQNLDKWKINNWNDPNDNRRETNENGDGGNDDGDDEANTQIKKKTKKTLAKNLKRTKKHQKPSQAIIDIIKKTQAKYMKDKNLDNHDDVIFIQKTNKVDLPSTGKSALPETPLRRSIRLLSRKDSMNTSCTGCVIRNSLTPRLSTSKQVRLQRIIDDDKNVKSRCNSPQQQRQQRKQITMPAIVNDDGNIRRRKRQSKSKLFEEEKCNDDDENKEIIDNQFKTIKNYSQNSLLESKYNTPTSLEPTTITGTNSSSLSFNSPSSLNSSKPSNYLSPYVTVSRGKVSAKKEQEKRNSLYKLELSSSSSPDDDTPQQIRHVKEAIKYFRNLLQQEIDRLNEQCNKWQLYNSEKNIENIETKENCNDMINATIGQTNLLLNKKMKQFHELINQCEHNIPLLKRKFINNEELKDHKLILPEDLEGFWSMICLQIENVDKRFLNLDKWKSNNWNDPEEEFVQQNQKKIIKGKQMKRKPKQQNSQPSNAIREMMKKAQAKYAKKYQENNLNSNEDMIFISSSNKQQQKQLIEKDVPSSSSAVVLPPTPLRRSNRLSSKTDSSVIVTPSYSTSKQARLQTIVLSGSSGKSRRSSTPKLQNTINKEIAENNLTLQQSAIDKNTSTIKKSILKQPKPTAGINNSAIKRRVIFSEQLNIHVQNDANNMSGINLLNTSDFE